MAARKDKEGVLAQFEMLPLSRNLKPSKHRAFTQFEAERLQSDIPLDHICTAYSVHPKLDVEPKETLLRKSRQIV